MFERIGDSMEISDIALHWGKEADRTASLIESKLVEFFRERAKRNHGGNWILDSVIDQTWDVHAEVTREDIREFCEHADMPGPRFWFGREAAKVAPKGRCREWLRKQVASAQNGKWENKKTIFERARAEFGEGLSRRSFNELWNEVVPDDWKRPGRPKKS